ncbi:uncharacterized protein LOC119742085 isoform X2 [Patiria miniata]|uniref:Uncharacterized protein n=1 Tax=Patiria miniata TaxID=46514 RepID=A0A914BDG2_PATMI|nr:uncharacterized protein LOC119742085 isoform X2 [Patiria miniata]
MAQFVLQLLLVIFVTLFSLSKASEHQCRHYYVDDVYHDGLICPQGDYDSQRNLNYCCQTIIGNDITEECCTKSDWKKNPDSNPEAFSTESIIGLCIGGTLVIATIVSCAVVITRRRRRRAVILTSRCAAQSTVIGIAPPPSYDQVPRVGQYRQFENPPSYPIN